MRYLRDGQIFASAVLLPGDVFGIDAVLFGREPEDLVAVTDCVVDWADHDQVEEALGDSPELAAFLMWQGCNEARRSRRWLAALGRGTAEQRVALLLLELAERLAGKGGPDPHQANIPFPLTQQGISDLLGLTSVHVNRVLKRLRDSDVAVVRGGQARLCPAMLAELAAPLLNEVKRARPGSTPEGLQLSH